MNILKNIFISFVFTSVSIYAEVIVPLEVENGKTFVVSMDAKPSCKVEYLGNSNYPQFTIKDKLFFILSTSYRETLGFTNLKISCEDFNYLAQIEIKEGNYKKETIKVSSKIFKQDEETKKRIEFEYNEAMQIYKTYDEQNYLDGDFILPIDSKITSYFGNKRVFNGEFKSYHSGTDFRAEVGSKIVASNGGKVVISKDRYYAGKSVVIDHGFGLYSCYFHLSQINVKVGQIIKKGDILGLSGQSGRVSGPHLHYGFIVGGVNVDPLLAINQLNNILFVRYIK